MSTEKQGVRDFFSGMGATFEGDNVTNWKMDFRVSSLNWDDQMSKLGNHTFPMAVAQILETPRGPTPHQASLKGIIAPNFGHSDENGRINVGFGMGFLNAVILYMYELFKEGEYEQAYGLVSYLKYFEKGIHGLNPVKSAWILTSSVHSDTYLRHGTVTETSSENPYAHKKEVFNQ